MISKVSFCFLVLTVAYATSQQCGVPKIQPISGNYDMDRIVGGKIAKAHSWPWQVTIINGDGHFCGGALINSQFVLTAAHCLERVKANSIGVVLGKHNLDYEETGEQLIYVSKIIMHPNYQLGPTYNDIGLLKLKTPARFSNTVQPVCLPNSTHKLEPKALVYITGWGSDGWEQVSSKLKQTMVPVIDWLKCRRMRTEQEVMPGTICTGFDQGGHNSCFGDSGGPLVAKQGDSWYVHGVVSWGPMVCGVKEEPAVFTKVADYSNWIQNTMSFA